jgi:alpha-beta hydrolase superfamily lysophospholipase
MLKLFVATVGLLFVAACEPTVRAAGPVIQAPELAEADEDGKYLIASDGVQLPLRVWAPGPGDPPAKAILIALHGFNEYSKIFETPAQWWSKRRIIVYAYDQRGFGETKSLGIWPGNQTLAHDLKDAVRVIAGQHPELPIYLLGVSMGGAVIMSALDERYPESGELAGPISGIILSAPAVWGRSEMHPFFQLALWLSAHTFPANIVTGRGFGVQASDNVEMLKALGRDPLIIKETRIDAVYGVVGLMDAGLAGAAGLRRPMLVLYGENDQIVPLNAIEKMRRRLDTPYRYVRYAKGWHMLLHDLQAETVWRDIAAWIDDRRAALPSGEEVRLKKTAESEN